jgi:hypothetical protein
MGLEIVNSVQVPSIIPLSAVSILFDFLLVRFVQVEMLKNFFFLRKHWTC